MMLLTVQLRGHSFFEEPIVLQLEKDILGNLGLQLGSGAAKDVEADVEPLVYIRMDDVILVAERSWRASLRKGLCLCCGSVLVGP